MNQPASPPARRRRLPLLGLILAAVIGLLGALVGVAWLTTPRYELPEPPKPNAYEVLLEEAIRVEGNLSPGLDLTTAPLPVVAQAVATNREFLDRAALAVGQPGLVPLQFRASEIETALNRAQHLRGLGRFWDAEVRLRESEGRVDEAVDRALDLVRLGHLSGRGGLLVEVQVGLAIEGLGLRDLHRLADQIAVERLESVLTTVRELGERAEPFLEIRTRELAFASRSHGFWMGMAVRFLPAVKDQLLASLEMAELGYLRVQAQRRLVMTELALRLHRERGVAYPESLGDLTPAIVPSVPEDPFTGRPFVYERTDDGYRLYSLGPDRKDDGGRPLNLRKPREGGDLTLDSLR